MNALKIEDSESFLVLWNFDWFPSFLITVRQGRRGGTLLPYSELQNPSFCVFYCHRGSHVAMGIWLFYLCFSLSLLLLFQGHVAFQNSTLTGPLHYMALHCITSATTRPPTNLSLELSPSLHGWRDSGARGTFSATTQSEAIRGAARESTLTLYPLFLRLRRQNNTALPR